MYLRGLITNERGVENQWHQDSAMYNFASGVHVCGENDFVTNLRLCENSFLWD